ncbi:MAG: chemotaxis response regulator protein-glutamate methylesterase [Tissierellia bacterium]|nr:chemotaxis response regulator protein-glutamate methylesterase [Tissierellia bacterium]
MIRLLIVDDSPFMRKVLTDICKKDEEIIVVGEAGHGEEALKKIPLLKPDVITLDIEMPIMDGIDTLKNITKNYNIPVVMISSLTTEGANLTLKALEEGAIDFIPKPKDIFKLSDEKIRSDITNKIKAASKYKIKLDYKKKSIIRPSKIHIPKPNSSTKEFEYIIAIGTSTGGPRALQSVLPLLSAKINAAIVVVQHMPPKFTKSLSDRLNVLSNINVKEGEEGDVLKRGCCYIAPGDYHMRVETINNKHIIRLNKEKPIKGLRPAADILMESVAKLDNLDKVGIVMTGMGSDGARGITEIKKSNGYIIAQDKESSVVFGMPKLAIETGCVDKIIPLNGIANEIMSIVGVQ